MQKVLLRELPDAALTGRRVIVRVDYNVPIEAGEVTDDSRIRATLPTLHYLLERGARLILLSHLGRPRGEWNPKYSLAPVATRLRELVAAPVRFVEDVAGPDAHAAVDALADGEILVLENVRFLQGEEANDPKLGEALAAFGDVFVNDAFGAAHRAHATTSGLPDAMRANGCPAVAGCLMEAELRFLGAALADPERPFTAVLGGAKISGKIDVIESLLPRVDRLIIGGAMANTFLRALGLETGKSLIEPDRLEMAADLLRRAGPRMVLPVDCVVAAEAERDQEIRIVERSDVPADLRILDIGPASISSFAELIGQSRTVLWNGPMGFFEIEDFATGTRGVASAIAAATDHGAVTIAGGGDTAAAIDEARLGGRFTHVSTGGGASLEFLEGRTLPGVAALDDAEVS